MPRHRDDPREEWLYGVIGRMDGLLALGETSEAQALARRVLRRRQDRTLDASTRRDDNAPAVPHTPTTPSRKKTQTRRRLFETASPKRILGPANIVKIYLRDARYRVPWRTLKGDPPMRTLAALTFLLLLVATAPAHGAAILLTDGRQLSATADASFRETEGSVTDSVEAFPSAPFAPWDHTATATATTGTDTAIASAFQRSTITPDTFTAELSAGSSTVWPFGLGEAMADFRVGFELTTPHNFVLMSQFFGLTAGGGRGPFMSLTFGSYAMEFHDLTLTGVLDPGVYDFHVWLLAGTFPIALLDTSAFGELVFTLTPAVPEPSAWLLMGAAVAGAASLRRRYSKS